MSLIFYDSKQIPHKLDSIDNVKFRPGVYSLIRNDNGQILMIVDGHSKKWEIPGGGLEIGEDLTNGAIREVKEETGYDIELDSDLPFYIDKDLAYSRGKYQHGLNFYFIGKLKNNIQGKQNFAQNEDVLEVKFFDKEELKNLDIVFWQKKAIEIYFEKI
jgi:8-oxo-dGTP pyrophosphatase MutT (NUDIX family)